MIFGIRGYYTTYKNSPNLKQTVFEELGLKTDVKTGGFKIQPRVQFSWDINKKKTNIIRVCGVFLDLLSITKQMTTICNLTGPKIVSIDFTGANLPTPDFESYRNNPASANEVGLLNNPNISPVATIHMNSKDPKIQDSIQG